MAISRGTAPSQRGAAGPGGRKGAKFKVGAKFKAGVKFKAGAKFKAGDKCEAGAKFYGNIYDRDLMSRFNCNLAMAQCGAFPDSDVRQGG